jgi:hypothetical protein
MVDTVQIDLDDFFEDKDYNKTYQLTDGGTPVDITSYAFRFRARLPESNANAVDKLMSITTAASGLFSVALDSSDTNLSTGRTYAYQIQGTTAAGEQYVYVTGEFEVKKTY